MDASVHFSGTGVARISEVPLETLEDIVVGMKFREEILSSEGRGMAKVEVTLEITTGEKLFVSDTKEEYSAGKLVIGEILWIGEGNEVLAVSGEVQINGGEGSQVGKTVGMAPTCSFFLIRQIYWSSVK